MSDYRESPTAKETLKHMIKIHGNPKSSALFYWTEQTSPEKERTYFASYFTISPVEMDSSELPFQEGVSFTFPIMVHEPIPCVNIEKIISDARERNAAIVDCGRTTVKSIRARMKKALGEYLQAFISYYIDMEQKQEEMASKQMVDINLQNVKKKLRKSTAQERIKKLTEQLNIIRKALKDRAPREKIEEHLIKLNKYRSETTTDFDYFLANAGQKGKIAERIIELYLSKLQTELDSNHLFNDENEEELQSLFILSRIDGLREKVRKQLGNADSAITTIEEIYRIKNLNPSFCSSEDLNKFCDIVTERGIQANTISKKYIDKYFMVISKRFKEAGILHKEIKELEEKFQQNKNSK